MSSQTISQDPSGPLERYIQILEALAAIPGSLTLAEIADLVDLPISTVHRLLGGLARSGLAAGGRSHPYELGERLIRLLHAATDDGWARSLSQTHLQALAKRTGETCYLARLVGARVFIAAALSPEERWKDLPDARWRSYAQPRVEMPINAAASAKAIMAFQDKVVLEKALSEEMPVLTANARNSVAWIEQHFAQIRRQGYATCIGEIDEGVGAIAVPVRLTNGTILYSVALTGPLHRIMNNQFSDRISALRSAADALAVPLSIGLKCREKLDEEPFRTERKTKASKNSTDGEKKTLAHQATSKNTPPKKSKIKVSGEPSVRSRRATRTR
ncbi:MULTISPECIES: IclR family transcriptional regulator [Bradyrhizobium]|uniref:IclR family transcriptional regulator n=1 Tax=Bradyrhizobium TaxID=374 RepID=UPI00131EC21D|nr:MULTISPECIES: IclR family transcriptional regulator C-terminal domain-containing protein [Bradyrhizobium]UFW51199.1 helix-turn-helix domain-containing protein [Bradyrhizobium arachidis]